MAARSRPCRGKQVAREGASFAAEGFTDRVFLFVLRNSFRARDGAGVLAAGGFTDRVFVCAASHGRNDVHDAQTTQRRVRCGVSATKGISRLLTKLICGNRIPAALQTGGTAECASEDTSICRSPAPRRAKASECREGPRTFWHNPSRGRRLALRVAGRCTEGTVLVRVCHGDGGIDTPC